VSAGAPLALLRPRLQAAGYHLHAVLPIARITEVLLQAGRLSAEQAASLGKAEPPRTL
jgi:hypothetical protein